MTISVSCMSLDSTRKAEYTEETPEPRTLEVWCKCVFINQITNNRRYMSNTAFLYKDSTSIEKMNTDLLKKNNNNHSFLFCAVPFFAFFYLPPSIWTRQTFVASGITLWCGWKNRCAVLETAKLTECRNPAAEVMPAFSNTWRWMIAQTMRSIYNGKVKQKPAGCFQENIYRKEQWPGSFDSPDFWHGTHKHAIYILNCMLSHTNAHTFHVSDTC